MAVEDAAAEADVTARVAIVEIQGREPIVG